MHHILLSLFRSSRGATAIEYGLIAAMQGLGNRLKIAFSNVQTNRKAT